MEQEEQKTEQSNMKPVVFIILAMLIIVGLFFILKPKSQDNLSNSNTSSITPIGPKVFDIVVKNKKIVSGGDAMQVTEGDSIVMKFTLDQDEEVHLHGYDKKVELTKNVQGELDFTANLTGRFPFELEGSGTELGVLEVLPK